MTDYSRTNSIFLSEKVSAIILFGGKGTRLGAQIAKQYLLLDESPIFVYTLKRFSAFSFIHEVVAVVPEADLKLSKTLLASDESLTKVRLVVGGQRRQDSVFEGLKHVNTPWVVVHDGVRPFIQGSTVIEGCIQAFEHGAAIVAMPMYDTLKRSDEQGRISETLPRHEIWAAQTPQVFQTKELIEAHKHALQHQLEVTDDASLFESLDKKVKLVEGSRENIKITTSHDLDWARWFVKERKI